MLREMALVASLARPYVEDPRPMNLVGFPKRDATHWRSASWRDSDAGYAGGRFAMDINVIWVPKALESIATILTILPTLGFTPRALDSTATRSGRIPWPGYALTAASLRAGLNTWKGARKHFEVNLSVAEARKRIEAKLAWLPRDEGRFWRRLTGTFRVENPISFLALSLDSAGTPIPVVNTDPATELFLEDAMDPNVLLRDVMPFALPFPLGLLVPDVGPLVANDAYAPPAVWERFRADTYHGSRVVWGREVNLFLIGVASQISSRKDESGQLREALRRILDAVNASGLQHNELWSYEIKGGRLLPVRYGTSSDVQLWNATNLVVQYVLSKLPDIN
jgi:hypothetical protein